MQSAILFPNKFLTYNGFSLKKLSLNQGRLYCAEICSRRASRKICMPNTAAELLDWFYMRSQELQNWRNRQALRIWFCHMPGLFQKARVMHQINGNYCVCPLVMENEEELDCVSSPMCIRGPTRSVAACTVVPCIAFEHWVSFKPGCILLSRRASTEL